MSKHTPGPWRIGYWAGQCHKPEHRGCHPGPGGANGCVYDKIFRDGGCEIAGPVEDQMVVSMDYDSLVISDADLRLIAAAPELLEALTIATEYIRKVEGTIPRDLTGANVCTPDLRRCEFVLAKVSS